jgi:hypothetical protein
MKLVGLLAVLGGVISMSGVAYMCCDGLRMIKWSIVDL